MSMAMKRIHSFDRHMIHKENVKHKHESRSECSSMMTHHSSGMPRMENPTKRFGKVICWIENSRNVPHDDVTGGFPILNGKTLNVNMS